MSIVLYAIGTAVGYLIPIVVFNVSRGNRNFNYNELCFRVTKLEYELHQDGTFERWESYQGSLQPPFSSLSLRERDWGK